MVCCFVVFGGVIDLQVRCGWLHWVLVLWVGCVVAVGLSLCCVLLLGCLCRSFFLWCVIMVCLGVSGYLDFGWLGGCAWCCLFEFCCLYGLDVLFSFGLRVVVLAAVYLV